MRDKDADARRDLKWDPLGIQGVSAHGAKKNNRTRAGVH